MNENDQIIQDIGRKCAEDVSGAIRRNMLLMLDGRGKMMIASYAAATAIGAANGAFAAYLGGPTAIDEQFVDQLWDDILRPMVLGQLSSPISEQGVG